MVATGLARARSAAVNGTVSLGATRRRARDTSSGRAKSRWDMDADCWAESPNAKAVNTGQPASDNGVQSGDVRLDDELLRAANFVASENEAARQLTIASPVLALAEAWASSADFLIRFMHAVHSSSL
jgi:hypothetical protein